VEFCGRQKRAKMWRWKGRVQKNWNSAEGGR